MQNKADKFEKEKVQKTLSAFFKKRDEVLLAYLFGSVAEDKQNKLSDLDIAVLVEGDKLGKLDEQPFGYQVSAMTDLISLLKTNDVDLVILNYATPLLSHEVIKYGEVIFCRDEEMRIQFEVRTLQQYIDTKPLRDIQHEYLVRRIKSGTLTY